MQLQWQSYNVPIVSLLLFSKPKSRKDLTYIKCNILTLQPPPLHPRIFI